MLHRLLILLAFIIVIVFPATAAAGPLVGIGDQHDEAFNSELFQDLGVRHARVTIPWDAWKPGWSRDDADAVLGSLKSRGVEVLVVIGPSRYKRGWTSPKTYKKMVTALVRRHNWVRYWSPANEANLHPQLKKSPAKVVAYAKALKAACRPYACIVTSPSVIDDKTLTKWSRRYQALAGKPRIWLLHNYNDANDFRFRSTGGFIKFAGSRQVWLAETGGLIVGRGKNSRRWPKGTAHQVKVFNFLTGPYAKNFPTVKRVYIYQWRSGVKTTWDSGILDPFGNPRPLYNRIAEYMAN